MRSKYDVIVVGARCAGSTTAMLLARKGYRVLAVDRATFPSDALSTHMINAPGVAALRRFGLLEAVIAAGTPAIDKFTFNFALADGSVSLSGRPLPSDGIRTGYAPRRTLLDKILVDAAIAAGVEIREGCTVDDLIVQDDVVVGIRGHDRRGGIVQEHAQLVIGADGRSSRVAKLVGAQEYHTQPRLQYQYFTYWSGLPTDGFEIYSLPSRCWAAIPTNDDLTLVVVCWPHAERHAFRADIEGNYRATLELWPEFARRVDHATRVEPFSGAACANYFRKPFGPGWALVGDAAYNRDPITAQGISDAFEGAELLTAAVHSHLHDNAPFEVAMADYQRVRDQRRLPLYEHTAQLARLQAPSPELERLLLAARKDQDAMDGFVSVGAGTVSPAEYFGPVNVTELLERVGR
ncbi:FAD-dependent monooxygenase [Nocardia jejuensis]|uniref:FAD-dependent monooxygenase n=1 Tax=Nocardia jejuensis TaxID=328049 RepID=UPI00082A900D